MSIYWAPDDYPQRVTSQASGGLTHDIAAFIYEHDIPWDPPTLRALVRRIWAIAQGPARTLPEGSGATGRGFRAGR